jgi:hypothetical protein
MEDQGGQRLTPALDRLLNEARNRAVAEIRARIQHFLLEPDSADLMTLVTCDLGLLLDEVSRLQSIRQRQEQEIARLQDALRAGGASTPAPVAPGQRFDEPAAPPAQLQELATLRTASESLQAALTNGDWSACHAALETLRAGLGLNTENETRTGSG